MSKKQLVLLWLLVYTLIKLSNLSGPMDNLKAAFAGESQASREYLAFSKKAKFVEVK